MANLINSIKAMPAKNKGILIGVLILVIASMVIFSSWLQKADYQVLYANLSEEDAGLIIQKLNEQKVPYKASASGIMVPADKVYELRLQFAGQGLPHGGGVGFELFDKTNFAMTDFVQKLNYRRALQGELSRTIKALSEVEQSRVHLAIPEKSLFAKTDEKPKASVFVKLRAGRRLTKNQIQGIVHLVSSSVEGLDTKDVSVIDSNGEILTSAANDDIGATSSQLEYQRNYEKDLENRIISILEPVVGKGKVRVKVTALLDFTKIEKTEERFDPESQVIRSEQRNAEKSTTGTTGGVPGVASNLPGKTPAQTALTQGQSEKKVETINYEISKITSHTINSTGDVKRLSVVVLIDGAYIAQQGSKEKKYVPRSDEDMKKFEDMVKKAVGFTQDRGDEVRVVNMPFEAALPEELPESKEDIMPIVITVLKYVVPLLAVILLFILVVRPLIKVLTPQPMTIQQQPQLPLPMTVAEIEKAKVAELPAPQQAIEWARKNPKEAAGIIRSWLEES